MVDMANMWDETANIRKKRGEIKGENSTDVVIIGGGFTGLATAYFLSKLNLQVIVLEENNVGWGASSRNAGMLTTGYKKSIASLAKKFGVDQANKLLKMSVDCIRLIDEIVNEHKIDCSMSYSGGLKLAYKASHYESLKKEHDFMLENFGYETKLIEPDQLIGEINSPFYKYGGLLDPHSYAFHPANYAIGLAEVVEQMGGNIYENSKALSIRKHGKKFFVKTKNGEVKATNIVIATNGYTTNLTNKLKRSIIPIDSHVIATEPLPYELSKKLIPNNRVLIDTKNFLYYFRLTPDNRMLFGGRVNINKGSHKKTNNELFSVLRNNMIEVFPDLSDTSIAYNWSGTTGFTLDFMPHIGQTDDGMFFALGYCGHGAAMSTLFGKIISDNISEKEQGKTALEGLPLKVIPFHSQRAKVLNLIEHYFKLVDRVP